MHTGWNCLKHDSADNVYAAVYTLDVSVHHYSDVRITILVFRPYQILYERTSGRIWTDLNGFGRI